MVIVQASVILQGQISERMRRFGDDETWSLNRSSYVMLCWMNNRARVSGFRLRVSCFGFCALGTGLLHCICNALRRRRDTSYRLSFELRSKGNMMKHGDSTTSYIFPLTQRMVDYACGPSCRTPGFDSTGPRIEKRARSYGNSVRS